MSAGPIEGATELPQPGEVAEEATGGSLFEAILEATATATTQPSVVGLVKRFLRESSPWDALALWLRDRLRHPRPTRRQVVRLLVQDIAALGELLNRQVNAILHHPDFQKLEASWRGLHYLAEKAATGENIKVRVLNVTWRELARDMDKALEFDQSQLFQKVYEEEFGHPGGEPFGVLLGDYEVRHRPAPGHTTDDLGVLIDLSTVAAAAFAPFLAGVHPAMLALDSFAELERPLDLPKTFHQQEYLKWRTFRHSEDARFVGLTLPRVLWRRPYRDDGTRTDAPWFVEEVEAPDRSQYLWGNAVYAFGGVLIQAFATSGWLADIRGVPPDLEGGGVVTGLPSHSFETDRPGVVPKCSTDVIITDAQEKEYGTLGFIPLCHLQDTDLAAFYGNQSVQLPDRYPELAATMNARLSAMLQYTLCVSRFAHYLKVISREKLGSFLGPADCEDYLRRWLMDYTVGNDNADPELKARYPLREARVQVREQLDRPGHYLCVAHLRPHFQLDQMAMSVRLVTELAPGQPG